ncbi:MAG TPA: TIGR02186 family protein [Microvirga sp.]|jgi:uncharacterized protein (TIGR02186 family)
MRLLLALSAASAAAETLITSLSRHRVLNSRALLAACVLALSAVPTTAETLITSLSSHRVLISSNYTGTSIAVFGAIERDAQTVARAAPYEVVITVRGPRQSLVVREKEPLGPVWINQEQQKFPDAPSYLSVLSSRPLDEITGEGVRHRQKIGLDAIVLGADFTNDRGTADEPFREALLRLKMREGLYSHSERGVTFLTPAIFRAGIPLSATAPPGNYDVEVTLFADTVILARTQTSFELVKIGFEQQMGEFARDLAPIYGGATALLALFFGYLASVVFRRD